MRRWRESHKPVNILKRGLILCEGETEQNYFLGLITQEEYRRKFASISVEIYKPQNHSPKGLVNEAKQKVRKARREKDPYDFIWVVFDHDGHANISDAFNEASTYNPQIKIAFSVSCFEFFILLHFEKSAKAYLNCNKVISELKKHLPDYKKATNLFTALKENINTGLENSRWCKNYFQPEISNGKKIYNCDPYSNIHELVEYLFSLIDVRLPL
ncbi:MAG: RloB family protein [Ginsengibacter sp.]